MTDDAQTNWWVEGGDKIDLNVKTIMKISKLCFFVTLLPIGLDE